MKAVLVLVITWMVLVSEIVTTVQTASARGSRVSVTYVAPKDAAHQDATLCGQQKQMTG